MTLIPVLIIAFWISFLVTLARAMYCGVRRSAPLNQALRQDFCEQPDDRVDVGGNSNHVALW